MEDSLAITETSLQISDTQINIMPRSIIQFQEKRDQREIKTGHILQNKQILSNNHELGQISYKMCLSKNKAKGSGEKSEKESSYSSNNKPNCKEPQIVAFDDVEWNCNTSNAFLYEKKVKPTKDFKIKTMKLSSILPKFATEGK